MVEARADLRAHRLLAANLGLAQVSLNGAGGSNQRVRSSIVAASDRQRQDIVADYFQRQGLETVLEKVEPAAIEFERPLQELGLDSLTAFELKIASRSSCEITPIAE